MDPDGFATTRQTLTEELACLTAAPSPAQAAAVHEVEALASFQVKDTPATLAALQAMHESDPTWSIPADVAPPGGPLSRLDDQARAGSPSHRRPHPLQAGWSLVVDGSATASPPVTRAAVVVILNPSRSVVWSGLASADELPGDLGTSTTPSSTRLNTDLAKVTTTAKKARRPAVPLFIAAGGTALVSGGLWLAFTPGLQQIRAIDEMADGNRLDQDWTDAGLDPMTVDEVSSLYDRTRRLEVAAQVSTGIAVGLGTIGLVVAW